MRPPGSPKQLERRRRRAIRLLQARESVRAVARLVGSSVSSVMRWQLAYRRNGASGLAPKPVRGRPAKLSPGQKRQLVRLLTRGPLAFGYHTDLWTTRRVAELIRRHFGVRYHPNHLWRLLVGLGWSYQKPERRARERNEAAIERWKRQRWPAVKKTPATWRPSSLPR